MTRPLPDGPLSMNLITNRLGDFHCPDCGGRLSAVTYGGDRVKVSCVSCSAYDVRDIAPASSSRNIPPVKPATIEESYRAFLEESEEGD